MERMPAKSRAPRSKSNDGMAAPDGVPYAGRPSEVKEKPPDSFGIPNDITAEQQRSPGIPGADASLIEPQACPLAGARRVADRGQLAALASPSSTPAAARTSSTMRRRSLRSLMRTKA